MDTAHVERVWPSFEKLILGSAWNQFPPALQQLLRHMGAHDTDAYQCLRWARWMDDQGVLRERCPACQKPVWSYAKKKPKYRWRCVTKEMYEQQQRQRGNPKGIHSRDGCGLQFSDTKGTPFTNWKLPLGLVFLAVYCPAGQIEERLIQLGEEEHCQALRQALKGLQQKQHAWLARRMQQYANLFCGQLVLKHCPQLVRKSEQARVLTRLAAERISVPDPKAVQKEATSAVHARHKAMQARLKILKQLDLILARGGTHHRQDRLKEYRKLEKATRALAVCP